MKTQKTATVSAVRETSAPAAQAVESILEKAYPTKPKDTDVAASAWVFHVWIGDIGLHFFGHTDEQVKLVLDAKNASKLQIRDISSKDPVLRKTFRSLMVEVLPEVSE